MKDKFEIFQMIVFMEAERNHYGIYISIGQIREIMFKVNEIYKNYNESLSVIENVEKHFNRTIRPLGPAGSNRL